MAKVLETSLHLVIFLSRIAQSQAGNRAKTFFSCSLRRRPPHPHVHSHLEDFPNQSTPGVLQVYISQHHAWDCSVLLHSVHTDLSFCSDSPVTSQAECFSYPWSALNQYLWNWADFAGKSFVSPTRTEMPWEAGIDFPSFQTTPH